MACEKFIIPGGIKFYEEQFLCFFFKFGIRYKYINIILSLIIGIRIIWAVVCVSDTLLNFSWNGKKICPLNAKEYVILFLQILTSLTKTFLIIV